MKLFNFISGFIQRILKGKKTPEEQEVAKLEFNNQSENEVNENEQRDNTITFQSADNINVVEESINRSVIAVNESEQQDKAIISQVVDEIQGNKEVTNNYVVTKWYRAGEHVCVQGYDITGGLIYVGESLLNKASDYHNNDACLDQSKS